MAQYTEIIGHDNFTVETDITLGNGLKKVPRNLYIRDNRIFFWGMLCIDIGEFATPERAAEVWKDLKQAVLDGEESFTLPKA